ncbi:DDB1 and CUL4-associated factor 7 [Neolecta irregularis DAH-3]|uniref:DDB1 and CUL4-associated factor 7 n=1 Tax=Neolecta irregularis (strain DAH-3) TaxID=1198029 RepID=A0A1U7LL82_NEOID|nr:DDB1 and CUL4-associated factor 7 [Neolecta irregularis DAH-3]|eukprot:OLL23302.1 DDB1 and CUL4-associated factor 7 [Neolecta irregularis DAH-3]
MKPITTHRRYSLSAAFQPVQTISTQRKGDGFLEFPWPTYAIDWCKWQTSRKIAVGSFIEGNHNKVSQSLKDHAINSKLRILTETGNQEFDSSAEADTLYPFTKIQWEPKSDKVACSLLATTSDHLRIWEDKVVVIDEKLTLTNKASKFSAPLTSFDWNLISPNIIVTSSIDTTCTVWDIHVQTAKTQLIAHDREVFDVGFLYGSTDIFASVGSDGSVRMFDLRALEHSTIIYEGVNPAPLLRLSMNPRDANFIATFHADSSSIQILDIRNPGVSFLELTAHVGNVNCISWQPDSRTVLASGGDDCQILIWDVEKDAGFPKKEPTLSWSSDWEINNLAWGLSLNPNEKKIAVASGKRVSYAVGC